MREDGREIQEVLEGVDIYSFKKNKSKSEKTVEHSFFKKSFIVIQLQLYAFSPHPSTPPQPNPPPSPIFTLPLDFVYVSFIVAPVIPSPHCV